jgi:hypothetical protein
MEFIDKLSLIPLRRANARASQVIEIGFASTTAGHKLSIGESSCLTGPTWIESANAAICLLEIRIAVAERRHMSEQDVLPQELWDTLDAELRRRNE